MRIAILTAGSRGDVQPFVALARTLVARGHTVALATPVLRDEAAELAARPGLDVHSLGVDYQAMIASDEGRGALAGRPGAILRAVRDMRDTMGRMLEAAWHAAQGADVIVHHPKVLAGDAIAEALSVPCFVASPVPLLSPTRAFPAPIGPLPDLGPLNPLTYGAIAMAQRPFAPVVTRFRRDVLGLARSPRKDAVSVLYAFSEHVVPRPSDWPAHVHVTGAWFLDDEPPPSDRLARFVAEGTPPVYVGFGSMARDPERTTRTVVEALRRADVRAVVATGWGGLDRSRLEEHGDVLVVDSAPHAWLFPRCAAIVHHGGAGTTAAALRAGRPSIVCPFFGDQHFWAARVHALGVGPKPIRDGALDAARLADAIRAALCDAEMQARAAEIGEAIRREHGTEAAARTIERAAA